ncbi:MAG TPA: GntG family PLP-dependent aldolase [Methylomirabilota bacterium]|nr:GntG family PLP-dependent aldolase [Methylomirabilota bacterium]
MHDVVELRSDTFTLPTPAMRETMANAEVGDDVWEEDPTVKRLEALAAARLGKERSLFVASGTMGNLTALLSHTRHGQEIILDLDSHIFNYEVGSAAWIGGLQTRPIKTERGFLSPDQVRDAIRPANIHIPSTGLVCLENTHNRHSGTCCTPEEINAVAEVAHAHDVPVHLDGARLFNAAAALKRDVKEFTRPVDSVMVSLSKGLAAPVGSMLAGSADVIATARRIRKMLGGGMRQVGVLAAAGIIALERMVDRLDEDHRNARRLAEALAAVPGVRVDLTKVQTNIVIFSVARPGGVEALVEGALARKVRIHRISEQSIRLVTHKDIDEEDVDRALEAFREITRGWK